jgi:hypothetical protein
MFKLIVNALIISCSWGFQYPFTTITQPSQGNVRVIEPFNKKKSKNNIVFVPANLKSSFPSEIYNDFLYNLANLNCGVYIPEEGLESRLNLIKKLSNEEAKLTVVSHSNSALNTIDLCNYNRQIENLVLIDPIDFSEFGNQGKLDPSLIEHVNNLMVINSKKSKSWKWLPPIAPISSISISGKRLITSDNCKRRFIETEFGHFDIFDSSWANLMDKTVSTGFEDRNPVCLQRYHSWLSKIIISNNKNEQNDNLVDNYSVSGDKIQICGTLEPSELNPIVETQTDTNLCTNDNKQIFGELSEDKKGTWGLDHLFNQ